MLYDRKPTAIISQVVLSICNHRNHVACEASRASRVVQQSFGDDCKNDGHDKYADGLFIRLPPLRGST